MEPETSVARQRLGEHVTAATNTKATIQELLETAFPVGSAPRLYNDDPRSAERTENIRVLNLAAVKLTSVQMTKLPL
jgi:hypothetical protein